MRPKYKSRAIFKVDSNALLSGNGSIDWISVLEIVMMNDLECFPTLGVLLANQLLAASHLSQVAHHLVGGLGFDLFIVVPREVVASVLLPMRRQDLLDCLAFVCQNREPTQGCPYAVLFSDVR